MAGVQAGRERGSWVGPYLIVERTARRLVVEGTGTPLASVIAVGVLFLLLIVAMAPWRGGTRVPIAISLAVVALAIGFLIAGFVPRLERLTVDLEARECRLERAYLLAGRIQTLRIPLDRVRGVRCRRRVWQEAPDATVIHWSVELVGDERTWLLAEDDQEEPMQEFARLVAEVAGIPRHSFIAEGGSE